ncbi:MFS transporter [Mycolicibacterium sp. S2-37]|uniref:CynX/NimT family MFS transporter n=1 Tax=Mycolicibacterium sp. S2-37 TaxID=2810297 RepID=UPI001A9543FB|nr:MFS transporter [Mycolicibacterium sp. S2-37]MBO0678268.1 MFS transporter [Mycolicibacterium sp. S2-37]
MIDDPGERSVDGAVGRWRAVILMSGLLAISVNQRPALVAVGPLTPQLRSETGLGAAATSLLTTLPLLCFGVFAMVAPAAARRWGLDRVLAGAVVVLLWGIGLRIVPSTAALFAGSAVVGVGIAVTNVLLPGVIKRDYPSRTGPMMGLYSLCLNGGAALAAAASVPLGSAVGAGWRVALGLWGILAVAALMLWLPRLRGGERGPASRPARRLPVWRSKVAWAVASYMALQSLVYYVLIAWLPTVLTDAGLSASRAGVTASVMSIVGTVSSLLTPIVATRRRTQRSLVGVSAAGFALGLVGLLSNAGGIPVLWVVLLGIGQGSGIGLALTLFVLRTRSSAGAAELSGMAQTVGYLVAAAGPFLTGALHDLTGSWDAVIVALIVAVVALMAGGWIAAGDRYVDDDLPLPDRDPM